MRINKMLKIGIWAGKNKQGYTGSYCAKIVLDGDVIARIDKDFNLYKVAFKSTLLTRHLKLDEIVRNADKLEYLLNHEKTIIMNGKNEKILYKKGEIYK